MKLADFYIGCEFRSAYRAQAYRCTDIGSRVVVAQIIDDEGSKQREDPERWMEFVIQSHEFEHCEPLEI
jgi:hypothetical protein